MTGSQVAHSQVLKLESEADKVANNPDHRFLLRSSLG